MIEMPAKGTGRRQVIERIKKLLALADSKRNSNEFEALAAEIKATELMQKYDIKRSEVGLPPLKHQVLNDFPKQPLNFIKDIDAFNIALQNFAVNLHDMGEAMKGIKF